MNRQDCIFDALIDQSGVQQDFFRVSQTTSIRLFFTLYHGYKDLLHFILEKVKVIAPEQL